MDQPATTHERASRAGVLAVAAAVLGWFLLLGVSAGRIRDEITATLHRDEAIAWTYASLPLPDIPGALTFDVNPPLYFMALHTWLDGGTGAEFMRTLSVLAIVAAAVFAFDAARRAADGRAGWLASAFVIVSPSTLALAGLARPYALAFLLGTIALDAAIALVKSGRPLPLVVLGVAGGLLPLTHYWGGLLLATIMLALAVTALVTRRRWILTRALLATGLALVALLPWAPTLWEQMGSHPLAAHQPPTAWLLGRTLTLSAGGRSPAWVLALAALAAVGLAVWRWYRRPPDTGKPGTDPVLVLLISATVLAFAVVTLLWLISQMRPLFSPNYAFVVMAPLPILVGVLMSRRWWTTVLLLAALALVAIPDFARSAFPDGPHDHDVRGPEAAIGEKLHQSLDTGDVVVTSPGRVLALRYYVGDDRTYVTPIGAVEDGVFDYRDRIERLQSADADAVARDLADLPAGTRIAFVHDIGAPWDHEYWIELDHAMDALGQSLRDAPNLSMIGAAYFPGPNNGIRVVFYEVA